MSDALWPHFQWAEAKRLVVMYGYPKDNVVPPDLRVRLYDPTFKQALLASLREDPEAIYLEEAVHTLVNAAAQGTDLGPLDLRREKP